MRRSVVAGLAAILVAFAGLTAYSIFLHRETVAKIGLINSSYLPLTLGASEIGATQLVFNTWMDRLSDDSNQSIGRVWIDAARRYRPSTLRRLTNLADQTLKRDIPENEAAFLKEMRRRLGEVEQRYLENENQFQKLYDLMDTGRIEEARVHVEALKRVERLLDRVLSGIIEEIDRHVKELAEEAEQDGVRATWILALLTLAAVLVAVAVIVYVNRVLAPLKSLQQAVAKVAEGDLKTRIDVARHDEIGVVADGFNRMTSALAERDQMLIRSERLATTGKMAAQVTHEIRNPLSSLRLNAELLEEELAAGPARTEASTLLKAMQDEIERLTGITEAYLRFARLPSPTARFDDLNTTVEAALEFMKSEIEGQRIAIETDLCADLGPVLFDRSQIRQALTNLLLNACEAMPEGGVLRVATRVSGGMVELTVSDTGEGVPAEALEHIFESFYSTKRSGTGLGLSLVRQICQAHGGNASCLKTGKTGSTFVIALPGLRAPEQRGEK